MLKEQVDIDDNVIENMKSLTLLCVEDDISTQLLYKTIFKEFVNKILFAKDGEDGYEKYLTNQVDIIISNYNMPKLNGLDMIKRIRKSNKEIPIILAISTSEVDIIVEALQLNVNNFIKKPIKAHEIINTLVSVLKIIIADKYLQDQKNSKLKELEAKDQYSSYQEDLAFAKELNILRNDFYYQLIDMHCTALVDFSYQPLDILSGDAYSARKIDKLKTFYLIVDGMGKGLSASFTSMFITSFINHLIDTMQDLNNFDLHRLIYQALEYIKPILLDEEALSVDFIVLDCKNAQMEYAKFSMPTLLMQTKENKLIKLKSNNPTISKYIKDFNISTYDTSEIIKFMFYSDGMIENSTRFKDKLYIDYIESDFLDSFTKENMKEKLLWKIATPEDDITFIFINKLDLINTIIAKKSFNTDLNKIEESNEWYADIWNELTTDTKLIYNASIVFTELFMNAYEHGNLGLNAETKHKLIEEDTYLNTLLEKQEKCDKKIDVIINKIDYNSSIYIITQINDEGEGFDTQILSKIFRNSKSFNGRGVFVSRSASLGIYYNSKGNSVLFLHKV
jgi:CheY-like chemotaxis protein